MFAKYGTYLWVILLMCWKTCEGMVGDTVFHNNIAFLRYEVPRYKFVALTPQQVLHMDYASYDLREEEINRWKSITSKVKVYEIDLVFTLYPKDIKKWRTDYHQLLSDRLSKLFDLDSTLNDSTIRWNMILQTECQTEEEAKDYFHGFVIKYQPLKMKVIDDITNSQELRAIIRGVASTKDSTIFKVLERNPGWNHMLVVADWTGSMYKYGAQLVLWHKQQINTSQSRIRHLVFFNDGNNRKNAQKRIGKTGGIYYCKSTEITEILKTMEMVMKKGNGGDSPENDIEALLTGINVLEGFEEVVLIADNKSAVRDLALIRFLKVPVRIILCDIQNEQVHPDYVKLAYKSGGSIHTFSNDIFDIDSLLKEMQMLLEQK